MFLMSHLLTRPLEEKALYRLEMAAEMDHLPARKTSKTE